MSLLATSLRKPKKFSLKKRASVVTPEAPAQVLPSSPAPAKFAQVRSKKRATFYEGLPPDLFDIGNELGQKVIDALYRAIEAVQAQGLEILPSMPTVTAYQAELALLEAIGEGRIGKDRLRALVEVYIETHTGEATGAWTDRSVPLFYITIKECSKTVEGYTANYIQVCIIRELWLRTSPEASFDLTRL